MHRSPERMVVAAGGIVYRDGERADCAYLLLNGSVELRANGEPQPFAVRQAGELFGDLALVDDSARDVTAVAIEDCELLAITPAALADRVADIDPLLRICLAALAVRYSEAAAGQRPDAARPAASPEVLPIWTARSAAARHILSFEHELRTGIERGELDLHFQPIVHLASGRLAGFEGLVRWRHPTRGLLLPGDFIPFAETCGAISDITTVCLKKVGAHLPTIRAAAALNPSVAERPFISVNVSGIDLAQSAFAATTVSILCDAGVDPEDVRLEVTESILMKDADRWARTLENCRDQGLAIAIDDFGTGYSSLHYLNALPISILKIDQSFCRSMLAETPGRKIIAAILHLGRELGLSVVAEGVELVSQRDLLDSMGCDFGQGYLFGAAGDLAATLELIGNWRCQPRATAVTPAA